MPLEEFPHERTGLEVSDAEAGPAPRSAIAVLRPTMAHSGDCAEHHLDAVPTGLVRLADGRPHVVGLDRRAGAAVARRPAVHGWPGARVTDGPILCTVEV